MCSTSFHFTWWNFLFLFSWSRSRIKKETVRTHSFLYNSLLVHCTVYTHGAIGTFINRKCSVKNGAYLLNIRQVLSRLPCMRECIWTTSCWMQFFCTHRHTFLYIDAFSLTHAPTYLHTCIKQSMLLILCIRANKFLACIQTHEK